MSSLDLFSSSSLLSTSSFLWLSCIILGYLTFSALLLSSSSCSCMRSGFLSFKLWLLRLSCSPVTSGLSKSSSYSSSSSSSYSSSSSSSKSEYPTAPPDIGLHWSKPHWSSTLHLVCPRFLFSLTLLLCHSWHILYPAYCTRISSTRNTRWSWVSRCQNALYRLIQHVI